MYINIIYRMTKIYMPNDIHPMDEEEINYRYNKYIENDYVPSDSEDVEDEEEYVYVYECEYEDEY